MKIRFFNHWIGLVTIASCISISHGVDSGTDIILNSPDDFPGMNQSSIPVYIVAADLDINNRFPVTYDAITFKSSPESKGFFSLNLSGDGNQSGLKALIGGIYFRDLKNISLSNFNLALSCDPISSIGFLDNSGLVSFKNNKAVFDNNPGGDFIFARNKGGLQILSNGTGIKTIGSIFLQYNQGDFIAHDNTYALSGLNIVISDNQGNMDFSGNKGEIGSSLSAFENVTISRNVGDMTFSRNSSAENYRGGNIYAQGASGIQIIGNRGKITFTGNYSGAAGGALDASFGNVVLSENQGQILFQENTVSGHGGAIFSAGNTHISNNKGSITFIANRDIDHGRGGAIHASQALFMGGNTGDILFERNSAGSGGAIISFGGMSIIGNIGNISFLGNNATEGYGGAIYAQGISLTGNMGDMIFRSNFVQSSGSLILNSICNTGEPCRIVVPKGYSAYFYDPIQSYSSLELNETGNSSASTGDIVFSGKYAEDDWQNILDKNFLLTPEEKNGMQSQKEKLVEESRYSYVKGDMVLHGGRLLLEEGVTVGVKQRQDIANTFTAKKGSVLEIVRNSTLSFPTIVLEPGVTLRTGDGAFIRSETIDMSRGVLVDFAPFMEHASSGVTIQATKSFYMGGQIYVSDTETSVNYYYADNKWSREQRFQTFSLEKDSEESSKGNFTGAASLATGTSSVMSPYIYQGTWSTEWEDSDEDGKADKMFVVWKPLSQDTPDQPGTPGEPADPSIPPTPGIRDILPELAGGLAMNSSWSSASNSLALSRAATGNLGSDRFRMERKNNYWIKGIGDFTFQRAAGARDGYDYNGGGYSVGADRKITSGTIFGLAFGNIFGKSASRSFRGNIEQTSDTGLLYGGWRKELNDTNALSITGSAGYGWTKNKMKSFHTGGESQGEWDNNTILAVLKTQWNHSLNKTWTLNVFLGVEYTGVSQQDFRETGWDTRHFDKGGMSNMSLPAGLGIGKLTTAGGMPWMNTLSASYVPDVYRDNPHADATRLINGYTWTARGISPARHAVRINFDSTLAITPSWTAYAGYEFEGRNRAVYHRLNAGMSFSY